MSLDELGASANVPEIKMARGIVSLEAFGNEDPGAKAAMALDDLAATPKKMVALDDLGESVSAKAAPNAPVALEALGNGGHANMVALEELGREEPKKVVKLEDLGEDHAAAVNAGTGPLFSRGTRTGRKRTMELKEGKVEEQEEVAEEVDPEEDETKAHVRILLASWALANKQEEALETPVKESEGQSEDESVQDEPVITTDEKKQSRWQRMKNMRSSLEWRKGKKEDKKIAVPDEESPEGQEESVQALLGSFAAKKGMHVFHSITESWGKAPK